MPPSNLDTELKASVRAEPERGLIVTSNVGTVEPAIRSLHIPRGATWQLFVAWHSQPNQPVDLSSGYTASLIIYNDMVSPYITMASGVAITLSADGMTIAQTAVETAAYTWGPRARYLLRVTDTGAGRAYALLGGYITTG